ncbi:hypothetical protein AKJ48_03430, partial [candidate division MSBL1 archaeon SCGC-AAA261O19]
PEENEKVVEEEEEFEKEEREVEVKEIGEDEIEIEAKNPDEEHPEEDEDEQRLKISTEEGAKFELEYEDLLAAGENEEGREVELEYEVEFDAIIEFADNNGNGLYDEGEEIYEYDLEDASFDPIQNTSENVSGVTVYTITMQTSDGVFKAIVHTSGKPITVNGENVTPNEVKIDIEITNFPYQENNSKLALKTELDSELEVEEEKREIEETDEEEVQVTSGNYGGFFSWKKTALVDGVSKPVKSTNISDDPEEGDRELYLIYEHGNKIVHDPKIGVRGAIAGPIAEINWTTVIVAAIVAALVSIGVTSLMLKRKSY